MAKRSEHGETVELAAGGHTVEITSPAKVMFPDPGITKLDLARYYLAVEAPIMRTVRDRPTLLQRFPNGVTGSNFFQKRIPDSAPDWLQTTIVSTPNGTTSRAIVMADIAHVLWAANLGCLGFHPWPYRASTPRRHRRAAHRPRPLPRCHVRHGAGGGRRGARLPRGQRDHRRSSRPPATVACTSTCGSSRAGTPSARRQAAVAVARALAETRPDLITDRWWKEERGARVFIDFNQNAPHKTVFGAWCVRARPGAQVSTPFAWDELPAIHPDRLTVLDVPARVAAHGDPWADIDAAPQSIAPLVERYERDLAAGVPDAPWPPVYPKMPDEARRVNPSRARHDDEDGAAVSPPEENPTT